jgi:hypothetical protein
VIEQSTTKQIVTSACGWNPLPSIHHSKCVVGFDPSILSLRSSSPAVDIVHVWLSGLACAALSTRSMLWNGG